MLRFLPYWIFVAAGTLFYWGFWGQWLPWVSDDAYIYLSFARTWDQGHGFALYPGGEQVEGFTSLVWIAICRIILHTPVSPEIGLRIISVLFTGLFLSVIRLIAEELHPAFRSQKFSAGELLLLLFLFFLPGFFHWMCLNGLDTPLYALAFSSVILFLLRTHSEKPASWAHFFCFFIFPFVRPEAMFFGIGFFLLLFILEMTGGNTFDTLRRRYSFPFFAFLAGAVTVLSFRLIWFGYPFPNTYYAKVGMLNISNLKLGYRYLQDFVYYSSSVFVFAFVSLVIFVSSILNLQPASEKVRHGFVSGTLLAGLAFPVLGGGDHFLGFRFYQHLYPLMLLPLVGPSLRERLRIPVVQWLPGISQPVKILLLLLFLYPVLYVPWRKIGDEYFLSRGEWEVAKTGRDLGDALNLFFKGEKPRAAVITLGGFAWAYQGPVLDLCGLAHVRMAHADLNRTGPKNHSAFDKNVFLAEKPELLLGSIATSLADTLIPEQGEGFIGAATYLLKGIYYDDGFRSLYVPALLVAPHTSPMLNAYYRKDFLEQLESRGYKAYRIWRKGE